ncbi:hypothetical protein [Microbacterium sp. NPDC057944]|uniref:hypothetical protein n=1 Tax=Microbacterium sp. NPDC057944 TaxID=3346286 RepID=UPI0036D8C8B4
MDARATRRGIPAGVIWAGFGVLAWAALTILTGGSAAHADEQDGGPLDGLTGLVSNTVSTVTAPVAPVVTQVVAPVVTAVVAPVQQAVPAVVSTVTQTVAQVPVVGPVAAPVVKTVTDTAQAVVAPVTGVLTGAPVSTITKPIVDAVTGLPIVGDLVDDLGVPRVVDDVAGVVDDTTGLVGGIVEGTIPPVLEALEPQTPVIPGEPGTPGTPGGTDAGSSAQPGESAATVDAALATATGIAPASAQDRGGLRGIPGVPSSAGAPAGPQNGAPSPSNDPASAPPGAPVSPSSSAGSGGGSAAAAARISDDGIPLLRAVEQDSGAPDDALPASPVADTDVSPD